MIITNDLGGAVRWLEGRDRSRSAVVDSKAGRVLFAAVHLGPYLSVAPLSRGLLQGEAIFLLDGPAQQAHAIIERNDPSLIAPQEDILLERNVMALIVGTSEGLPPDNLETRVATAARQAGVPIFVIEDFPGNFAGPSDRAVHGLFVEDTWVGELHRDRGIPSEVIHGLGNPRYDGLRGLPREEIRNRIRARLGLGEGPVVLWAGQPDGTNSFHTLERIAPWLAKTGATLLMKAHPRDDLYAQGIYSRITSGLKSSLDVTAERETVGLCCASDLVITQFSSVGVEALYLGTPTVFALFEDLGQAYLRRQKGYGVVPWAANGCAFLLQSSGETHACMEAALFDERERSRRLENFERSYGSRPPSGPAIAATISRTLGLARVASS